MVDQLRDLADELLDALRQPLVLQAVALLLVLLVARLIVLALTQT